MKNTVKIGLWLALLAFTLTACATTANVPLPQTISIEPAKPDVAPELAAFLAKWEGWWPGGMDAVLIVEKIDKHGATVIYAWGEAPSWKIKQGYQRYDAAVYIEEGKPKIKFGRFTVEMINPQTIERTHNKYNQTARMKKASYP